jgi:hypothetical protein
MSPRVVAIKELATLRRVLLSSPDCFLLINLNSRAKIVFTWRAIHGDNLLNNIRN